ncbi:MAG TPA: YicC/YloC family endoribonuclease [Spirochaetia bacterium]|nr:YicC/YloC family endoribonuclease [Spirochaetia bacterium]
MTSMTGFGHGESRDPGLQMALELRSYNNRFLDLSINLPYSLKQLEPKIREFLSSRIQRGKVELYLSVTELEDGAEVLIDQGRVRAFMVALEQLRRTAGIKEKPSLANLIGLEGVLRTVSRKDPEATWLAVVPLLEKVFQDFEKSRVTEGSKTEADLRRLAAEIRAKVSLIEEKVPSIETKIKESLRERFRELLEDGIDESRILAETAVQLVRFDINEEVQRMKAHLESFSDALGQTGPQGKRLDFVCQELGREINTIGSKSVTLDIDQAVIAVKDTLEKIREQLRNVE